MSSKSEELANRLAENGIRSFEQQPGQLIVSSDFPHTPDHNSFWVTFREGYWFLSTWVPVIYRIPGDKDVSQVCAAVLESSSRAIYHVADELVYQFSLIRLTPDETDSLLSSLFGSEDEIDES